MNKKIYAFTIAVSFLLMIPSLKWNNPLTSILSGIGCSGIAAAIMAIFLDWSNDKREKEKTQNAKRVYFSSINSQLNMLIERILWFDDRIDDESFNWGLQRSEYNSLKYMVSASKQITERSVSYEDAVSLLLTVGEKYAHDKLSDLSNEKLVKIQKMFFIIADSCTVLIANTQSIFENKLILDREHYISLEDTDQLRFSIVFAVDIMSKALPNYKAAITSIISASRKIRELGNYDDKIRIGLHGSFDSAELKS